MKPRYNIGDLVAFGETIFSVVSVSSVYASLISIRWVYSLEADYKQQVSIGIPERMLRSLTPEERAAYALGWRGPVAREPSP